MRSLIAHDIAEISQYCNITMIFLQYHVLLGMSILFLRSW